MALQDSNDALQPKPFRSRRHFRALSRPSADGGKLAVITGLLLGAVCLVQGQDSQFRFDGNGNLFTQGVAIVAPPQILAQPQRQIVGPGEVASFFVIVADTSGMSYQWRFNGTNISGASQDTLLLQNISATNEGSYSVVLLNSSGSVTSAPAALYIDSDGDGLPDSWELAHFGNLNQTATGDFDGDGVPNLQELLDGTDPTNAASALYRITLLNDGGTVVAAPDQPAYTNGQVVTLTATGSGAAPFYGWTGDAVSRSNSIAVTMNTNLNLFAHFTPITFQWTNTISGDWNVPSNWTPNLVPGSNDSVVMVVPTLVTLNSNADVADFTLGTGSIGPELTGTGTLTIHGRGAWASGNMSGTGTTAIAPGASLIIANQSFITLSGRTLDNGGTLICSGSSLSMNSSVITNEAGGICQLQSPYSFNFAGGSPRFDNAGTLHVTGTGTTTLGVSFNNYGTVDIQGGTFNMSDGGNNTGTITVPASTTLNFGGGIFTSSGSPSITGAGALQVSGGTANLGGIVNVTGTNLFTGGTANLTDNYTCVSNTLLNIAGGTANFDGSGTVAPQVLNLNGVLGGANTVTVGSAMSWTGGTMDGSGQTIIGPGATLNIAGFTGYGGVFLFDRTLENAGTVVWGGGNLGLSGIITNDVRASFQIQGTAAFNYQGGSPRFDNAGTFLPAPGGTNTFYSIAFNNYGAINLGAGGLLSLGGGGLQWGPVTVPTGATINYAGGTFNASAGSSITGAGTLQVSGGTANLGGIVNVTGTNLFTGGTANLTGNYTCVNNTLLDISGGTANFDGSGTVAPQVFNLYGTLGGVNIVTVGSAMNWTGGTMNGSGQTIIRPGATLNIAGFTGYGGVYLATRTLENSGTVVWGGGNFNMNGGIITNDVGASFQIQNPAAFNYGGGTPRFDNAGTLHVTGTGTTTLGVSFNNYGTVDIRSGFLAAGDGYVSSSNAVLNCSLAGTVAGTNYGQLQVSGSVTLNGTLNVNLTNSYIPTTNDSFTVVTAGTRNGTFANFTYPSNQVTMQLSNTINSVIVRSVGSVVSPPAPFLFPPLLSGSNVLLTWTAVSNTTYRVEFNPNFTPSNWNALSGDVTGLSNTASKLDTLTSSNRYYRILVIP